MPALQQNRAWEASARSRFTRKMKRQLSESRPLTESQRTELIAAAAAIPVTEGYVPTAAVGGAA